MKKRNFLVIEEREENCFLNTIDFGGTVTRTAIPDYARSEDVEFIEENINAADLIAKLDSLKEEHAVEYPNASEARLHIKKLMKK